MEIIAMFYIMGKIIQIFVMGFNAVTICANTYRYKMDSLFVGFTGMLFVNNWFSEKSNVTTALQPKYFPKTAYVDCNVLLNRVYANPIYKFTQYIQNKYHPDIKHLYIACLIIGIILLIIAIEEEHRVYDIREYKDYRDRTIREYIPKPGRHSPYREITKYIYMVIVCGYITYVLTYYGFFITLQNNDIEGMYNMSIWQVLKLGPKDAGLLYMMVGFCILLWACHLVDYIKFDIQMAKHGYSKMNV